MNIIHRIINNVYRIAVEIFSTAIFALLILLSVVSTCYIASDSDEVTFFCRNNFLINFLFLLCILTVIVLYKRLFKNLLEAFLKDDVKFNRARFILLGIIFCLSIIWVIVSQVVPGSDQLDVMSCAYKLRYEEYNMLESGGYLDTWRNQLGLTMIEYYFGKVFGDYNIIGFQLFNCIGILLFYKKVEDILELLGFERMVQILTLFCGIIFIPFIMYTAFVYGNIWSIALAIAAFDSELRFLQNHKWSQMILSAVLIGVAYQVKNNVLIILLAMMTYALVVSMKDKDSFFRGVVYVIACCIVFFMISKLPNYVLEKKTGYILNQGVSPWAFVAMGLQDDGAGPGWYNGYNHDTYYENNCITKLQERQAKEEIDERVNFFIEDNHYAFEFFSKKIASMWTEPTYQAFWIGQIRNHRVNYPAWLDDFMSVGSYTRVASLLGNFQLFLFFGCLIWLLLEPKETFVKNSFFILCIVGGFLFHLFWEAKSQYSITYVVLMIPMALQGFAHLTKWLQEKKIREINMLVLLWGLVIIVSYGGIYKYDQNRCLTADNDIYAEYVKNFKMPYTNESVLDINIMKIERNDYKGQSVYYLRLLEENGVIY
ncbi:hypothetical protein SAMN04487830_1162 [Pseudobutyrivibrio sp. OR37]|uniref:hypothetical protein n=1 Tax=Pseudobutyrivibrio sp. OR37 TaxID=1798186 RepID=UPI0008E7CDCB|nr:hypothetical protein [Pseudobutyrivibrio sp. OR37]SFH98687.1 hypothetical protein SAMN04487830_1162 [Pseudobutyrivibrio sp. OR37]